VECEAYSSGWRLFHWATQRLAIDPIVCSANLS
jgi:hypothetical protein